MAISIEWTEGGRYASAADTDRAQAAALDFLDAAGVTDHVAAEAAFHAAMDSGATDARGAPTDPLVAAWHNAQEAAIAAATDGWHNPEMGGVRLVAWTRNSRPDAEADLTAEEIAIDEGIDAEADRSRA